MTGSPGAYCLAFPAGGEAKTEKAGFIAGGWYSEVKELMFQGSHVTLEYKQTDLSVPAKFNSV